MREKEHLFFTLNVLRSIVDVNTSMNECLDCTEDLLSRHLFIIK